MKTIQFLLLFLSLIFSFVSWGKKSGNGWVSSGGDNLPFNYGASWYNHNEGEILYCLNINSKYSVKKTEIQKLISTSLETWKNYYLTHSGNKVLHNTSPNFIWKEDPTCKKDVKVQFYFDIENKITKTNKARYQNPYSFAAFNNDKNLGYFWFSDLKNKPTESGEYSDKALHALIMHELGHAFGVPHIPGTIMREDITKSLVSPILKTEVDHWAKLIYTLRFPFRVAGNIPENLNSNFLSSDIFYKFTGVKPVGKISAILSHQPIKPLDPKLQLRLVLQDDRGSYPVQFKNNFTLQIASFGTKVFVTYEKLENQSEVLGHQVSQTYLYNAIVIDHEGQEIPVVIDLNNNASALHPFTVRFLDKDKTKYFYLFASWF